MTPALSEGALGYACQRIEDFALVNQGLPDEERSKAIDLWLDHLGLDEPLRALLEEWFERFLGPGWRGELMVGLAIGLLVNQFHHDAP